MLWDSSINLTLIPWWVREVMNSPLASAHLIGRPCRDVMKWLGKLLKSGEPSRPDLFSSESISADMVVPPLSQSLGWGEMW